MSERDDGLEAIREQMQGYRHQGLRVFATSSFQTQSLVLLDVLARVAPETPIYFLNTGYHFAETLEFRDQVAERLGLRVITLSSDVPRLQQRGADARALYVGDPDHCCELNKVRPLDPILAGHDVWVSGVRADQTAHRAGMREEQPTRFGALRYHPLLGWDRARVAAYLRERGLPRHPLDAQGYANVSCRPCTRRLDLEADFDPRTGRWYGLRKTECGLHLEPGGSA